MMEEDAIRFATLHLDGLAYDWWQDGMTTQGHGAITSFDVINRRMIDRFDRKDEEDYFKDLTAMKQRGSVEEYVAEFQRIVVMVSSISKKRVTFLFTKGLAEP